MNKAWKWQKGDNPAWARSDFDDSKWQSINPSQEITQLSQVLQAGSGWLRLHFTVDTTLVGKVISMVLNQQTASQIYLNGRLIGSFGTVSTNPEQVQVYNPAGGEQTLWQSTHLHLDSPATQVLAVRFAIKPFRHYWRLVDRPNPFLLIRLHQADQRNQNRLDSVGFVDTSFLDYFKAGIFFILALLHLFFYSWYPAQKVNLWFGIYCLVATLIFSIQPFIDQYVHSVPFRLGAAPWMLAISSGAHLTFLGAVYSLFHKRLSAIFYVALLAFSIYLLLFTLEVEMPLHLSFLLSLFLTDVESTRLLLVARHREQENWILIIGAVLFTLFKVAFIINYFLLINTPTKIILAQLFYNLSILSSPISMTLFLARKFAKTNRSLAEKLIQVEMLSNRTRVQEQEKQHLLAIL